MRSKLSSLHPQAMMNTPTPQPTGPLSSSPSPSSPSNPLNLNTPSPKVEPPDISLRGGSPQAPDTAAPTANPQHARPSPGQPIRILHATLDLDLTVEPLYAIIEAMGEGILSSISTRLQLQQRQQVSDMSPAAVGDELFMEVLKEAVRREEQKAKSRIWGLVKPEAEKVWGGEVERQGRGAGGVVAEGVVVYGGDVVRVGEVNVKTETDIEDGVCGDLEMGGIGVDIGGAVEAAAEDGVDTDSEQDYDGQMSDIEEEPVTRVASGGQDVGHEVEDEDAAGEPDDGVGIGVDVARNNVVSTTPSPRTAIFNPTTHATTNVIKTPSSLASSRHAISPQDEQQEEPANDNGGDDDHSDPFKPYCFCRLPLNAIQGRLFGCEGPTCKWDGWFHEECVKKKLLKKDWPQADDGKVWLCCDCGGYAARKKSVFGN